MISFKRLHFNTKWLFLSLVFLSALGAYVNFVIPRSTVSIGIFFCILACVLFCFILFLTRSVKRAILYTVSGILFLVLRFIGLREWYFVSLLILTTVSTDAYFMHTDRLRNV